MKKTLFKIFGKSLRNLQDKPSDLKQVLWCLRHDRPFIFGTVPNWLQKMYNDRWWKKHKKW